MVTDDLSRQTLLVAQRAHRIHLRRPVRGDESGGERDERSASRPPPSAPPDRMPSSGTAATARAVRGRRPRQTDRRRRRRHQAHLAHHHPPHARRRRRRAPCADRFPACAATPCRRARHRARSPRAASRGSANAVDSTLMNRSRNTFSRICCGSVRVLDRQVRHRAAPSTSGCSRATIGIGRGPHVESDASRSRSSCRYGRKNSGGISFFTVAVLRVLHEADDLHVQRAVARRRRRSACRPAFASQVELLRERLVDDRDLRRAQRVGARELAAREQRHAERREIRRDRPRCSATSVSVSGPALKPSTATLVAPVAAAEQRHRRARHAGDPRQRARARPRRARTAGGICSGL